MPKLSNLVKATEELVSGEIELQLGSEEVTIAVTYDSSKITPLTMAELEDARMSRQAMGAAALLAEIVQSWDLLDDPPDGAEDVPDEQLEPVALTTERLSRMPAIVLVTILEAVVDHAGVDPTMAARGGGTSRAKARSAKSRNGRRS